ncbi:MAG: hypothetical protein KAS30_04130 [Candidatus Diapherotrites archaeon]|nr:hypothetical protein [Candidatus Diapherotrites archaeon]
MLSFGYSEVLIESPVQTNLLLQKSTHIGAVMPGQSFQFVMNSYCGSDCNEEWDTATIDSESLPKGWAIDGSDWNLPSFQVRVKVPENAEIGKYVLKVKMQDQGETIPSEYGLISVNVSNTLLSLDAESNQSTVALENGNIIFQVQNTSLSEANVIVSSSLLSKWWGKQKITIHPGVKEEFLFPIRITESGTYETDLILISENTNEIQTIKKINITATPTIQSKLTAPSHGFPLYPVSLQPIYSLMGAFSFLFNGQ